MSKLEIHTPIKDQLKRFYDSKKIPHILFYGPHGCGKKTLLNDFLELIYAGNRNLMQQNILYSNCSHSKGIKHIREILKEYARINVTVNDGIYFKTVVLYNFEDLSVDGQSALRRVIESFSRTTRFFVVSQSKARILTPILSRLAHIHIPLPSIHGTPTNLHKYHVNKTFKIKNHIDALPLQNELTNILLHTQTDLLGCHKNKMKDVVSFCDRVYNQGYSAMDLVQWLRIKLEPSEFAKFALIFCKVRSELAHERILLLFCLNFVQIRSHATFENISFL